MVECPTCGRHRIVTVNLVTVGKKSLAARHAM